MHSQLIPCTLGMHHGLYTNRAAVFITNYKTVQQSEKQRLSPGIAQGITNIICIQNVASIPTLLRLIDWQYIRGNTFVAISADNKKLHNNENQ